ncbi:MAG TPA: DUF488 domain-containing protein [Sedimentisphaerales bacterium]|jgi:uncharacterized protein (DUF488 family)|nr:DUF488 domain-containing protein [Sedimentisphaerales bacterium]HNU28315.1 DUF488 domain-containing protein [Sedimentisphaerales bacterium]
MRELFTVGHSNHTVEHVIGLLTMHNITVVADVRSNPYSVHSPQFNRELIQRKLHDARIEYVFLGGELGARRAEESCYVGGQAKYDAIKNLPAFRNGLSRVIKAVERSTIALLCSEADPLGCHRTILVCPELKGLCPGLRISHILGDGSLESHEQTEQRLIRLHKLQPELFGNMTSMSGLIERAYGIQAERIAYRRIPAGV